MSVLLEFSMFPTDRGESVGEYVARLVEIVHASVSKPIGHPIDT